MTFLKKFKNKIKKFKNKIKYWKIEVGLLFQKVTFFKNEYIFDKYIKNKKFATVFFSIKAIKTSKILKFKK